MVNEYLSDKVIRIVFNSEMLDRFTEHYKKYHPRAKKLPLHWCGKTRLGTLPLINRFLNVANRKQQNSMKQQFHEYTKFVLEENNIEKHCVDRCVILVKHYLNRRSLFDLDGIFVKSTFDALSDYEFWEDDNYTIIEPLIFTGGYDKDNPRSEIVVFPITEEYDREFVLECVLKELCKNK